MRALTCLLLTCAMLAPSADLKVNKYAYPPAKQGDVVDDYHGAKVADPYRWLEDTNSPETTAWVEAENKVTAAYFAQIPQRAKIHARLTELLDRKSTRLNSSHLGISYAVFCLKKHIRTATGSSSSISAPPPPFSAPSDAST